MPYIQVPVLRRKTFVPAEAPQIAGQWRGNAQRARDTAAELRSLGGGLDSSWDGNAADRFLGDFLPIHGDVGSLADRLEGYASQVESITVTEWESVVEQVWQADDAWTPG